MAEPTHTITALLKEWRAGDGEALDRMLPLVYAQLKRIATAYAGSGNQTLRPTDLVHEAYLRFERQGGSFEDRAHFFAAAALTMRRLMVDFARRQGRRKRGEGYVMVELTEELVAATETSRPAAEVVALDHALERLEQHDERKARAVELHFFGGLTYDEIADVLRLSPATVGRELRFARAWLRRQLQEGVTEPGESAQGSKEPKGGRPDSGETA